MTDTERRLGEKQLATYYYSGDSPRHQQGVGPPSTASVVCVSELQMPSFHASSSRHLSACLFNVSARDAMIAATAAISRRLSQQKPYKTCVSLDELGRTSRHFIVHLKESQQKRSPGIGVVPCARGGSDPIPGDDFVRH